MSKEKSYKVIVDETCEKHGGHNFAYQYEDENFVRVEEVCEGCNTSAPHESSEQLQSGRSARVPQERAFRPTR